MDKITSVYVEKGAKQLILQALNSEKTAYEGDKIQFNGLIQVTVTNVQTITAIAAEDDPSFIIDKSPLTADIEITFVGVPSSELSILTNAITKASGEIGYGDMSPGDKNFGVAWLKNESQLKLQYNNVYFDPIDDKSITLGQEGAERNLVLKAHGSPVSYVTTSGKVVKETYHTNKFGDANWDTVKNIINFPTEA